MSLNIGILSSSYKAVAPSVNLLLDDYPGAAAAYSLRKLRTAYAGSAIRVRRSDNTETDIGFVNDVLDTTTLLTFVGAGNGSVITWYDQSGNANNAITIAGTTAPPIIVINGVLQTQNLKPCIRFRGTTNSESLNIITPILANTNISIFMTAKSNDATNYGAIVGASGAPSVMFGSLGSSFANAYNGGLNGVYKIVNTTPNYSSANYLIYNCIVNSTNYYIYQNNNTFTFTTTNLTLNPTSFGAIGRYFNFFSNAIFSEIIFYKADQSSNRAAIINNTNTFYTIF